MNPYNNPVHLIILNKTLNKALNITPGKCYFVSFDGVPISLFKTASDNKTAFAGKSVCRPFPEARFQVLMNILSPEKLQCGSSGQSTSPRAQ